MSDPEPKASPWLFDDFEPGLALGEVRIALNERHAELWARLYGGEPPLPGAPAPLGLAVAGMMEAYIRALQPRPPGNVHAGQTLRWEGSPPAMGAELWVSFSCKGKEMRKGRRWLTLGVELREGDRLAMTGEILTIWAA